MEHVVDLGRTSVPGTSRKHETAPVSAPLRLRRIEIGPHRHDEDHRHRPTAQLLSGHLATLPPRRARVQDCRAATMLPLHGGRGVLTLTRRGDERLREDGRVVRVLGITAHGR